MNCSVSFTYKSYDMSDSIVYKHSKSKMRENIKLLEDIMGDGNDSKGS